MRSDSRSAVHSEITTSDPVTRATVNKRAIFPNCKKKFPIGAVVRGWRPVEFSIKVSPGAYFVTQKKSANFLELAVDASATCVKFSIPLGAGFLNSQEFVLRTFGTANWNSILSRQRKPFAPALKHSAIGDRDFSSRRQD